MTFKILTFSFDISRILSHSKPFFIFDLVDFTDFHFQHPSLQLHNSPQDYKPFLLPILYRLLPSWKNFLSENQSKPHLIPTKSLPLVSISLLISQIKHVIQQIKTQQLRLQHNTISFEKRKNFAYIFNMLELQHSVSPIFQQNFCKFFKKICKKRLTFTTIESRIYM